jgi:hypothetical protein
MCLNVVVDLRAKMELFAHSVLLLLLLVRRTNSADPQRLLTEADLVRQKTDRAMGKRRRDRAKEREIHERERRGLNLNDLKEEICNN